MINTALGFKSAIFPYYFGSTVFKDFGKIIEPIDFKLFNWIDYYCHMKEINGNYNDLKMRP